MVPLAFMLNRHMAARKLSFDWRFGGGARIGAITRHPYSPNSTRAAPASTARRDKLMSRQHVVFQGTDGMPSTWSSSWKAATSFLRTSRSRPLEAAGEVTSPGQAPYSKAEYSRLSPSDGRNRRPADTPARSSPMDYQQAASFH